MTEEKRFAPKVAVQLDPPKDDPISLEELAKCDGTSHLRMAHGACMPQLLTAPGSDPSRPTLVAIKGVVFDVTRNSAYGAQGQYRGRDLRTEVKLRILT